MVSSSELTDSPPVGAQIRRQTWKKNNFRIHDEEHWLLDWGADKSVTGGKQDISLQASRNCSERASSHRHSAQNAVMIALSEPARLSQSHNVVKWYWVCNQPSRDATQIAAATEQRPKTLAGMPKRCQKKGINSLTQKPSWLPTSYLVLLYFTQSRLSGALTWKQEDAKQTPEVPYKSIHRQNSPASQYTWSPNIIRIITPDSAMTLNAHPTAQPNNTATQRATCMQLASLTPGKLAFLSLVGWWKNIHVPGLSSESRKPFGSSARLAQGLRANIIYRKFRSQEFEKPSANTLTFEKPYFKHI